MKFLYPEFLWALSLIALPIIIHLFNFRKFKKAYFSDITLLENLQIETRSKSRLKHLLLLFSRILAIVALVLAFSYPYQPSLSNQTYQASKIVSIYIDNSLSMDMKGAEGFYLELAKKQAIDITSKYPADTRFFLLTNAFRPRHSRDLSRKEMTTLIEGIKPEPFTKNIGDVYSRQSDLLSTFQSNKDVYWLTDLQKTFSSINELVIDSTLSIHLVPYSNQNVENLYIDSIWFKDPNRKVRRQEMLFAKVINSTPNDIQFKLDLNI